MTWHESSLGKLWTSVSDHGLRGGILDALERWARKRASAPEDVFREYGWILNQSREASLPAPPSGPLRIHWLIPTVASGSGGLLTIFRTIQELDKCGHKQSVYVVGDRIIGGDKVGDLVRKNYLPINGDVEVFTGELPDSDALVATSWTTAYAARTVPNTARKFYMVQDLEHLFYPQGSLCEFSKETYRWGFYGITAGEWIARVLRDEFGMECSSFSFSYDRGVHSRNGERRFPDGKKRVLFYARASSPRRGFELGVLALSLVAKQSPETEFVLVALPRQSLKLPFQATFLETLPASELPALYRSCDAALVLSHTNLSLLPLELMACGCAVVSNSGPNVEWLLTDEVAQLATPTPEALADAILALLHDDQLRARKIAAGYALAESTDWLSEIKAVESAFYRGLSVPALVR